jgi:hypothetical protein
MGGEETDDNGKPLPVSSLRARTQASVRGFDIAEEESIISMNNFLEGTTLGLTNKDATTDPGHNTASAMSTSRNDGEGRGKEKLGVSFSASSGSDLFRRSSTNSGHSFKPSGHFHLLKERLHRREDSGTRTYVQNYVSDGATGNIRIPPPWIV